MGAVQKKMRNSSRHLKKLMLLVCACTVVALVVRAQSCFVFVLIAPPPGGIGKSSAASSEESVMEMEIIPPYAAGSRWEDMEWDILSSLSGKNSSIKRVGVLNFNSSEVARWRSTLPAGTEVRAVRLAPASESVTWEALYPEWIDEERSSCPSLPDPDLADYDLVAVKLPCRRQWSRDVRRLHLQLAAAKLAALGGGTRRRLVLILSEAACFPLPNLFHCKHLLARHGHAWLYGPDADYLRHRLSLPIGSCQISTSAPPLERITTTKRERKREERITTNKREGRREAYATVLHSGESYVCGAIALAQSIRRSGSTRDLVALVDPHVVDHEGLAAAGWQVRVAPRIRNPRAARHAYNEWNYSKFRLWQLTDYDKVVFLDADLLVLRNMDFLFHREELSATANSGARFNSGVMVLEPCNCTFHLLMEGIHRIHSYNGGDQGYLNEVFTWWHRLPRQTNLLKHFWESQSQSRSQAGDEHRLLHELPLAVHYLGIKPWLCYRDYDCNWDVPALRRFASDEAHALWWALHDIIQPAHLTGRFCALPPTQLAMLRRQRLISNGTAHWNGTITDPRAQWNTTV